MILKTIDFLPMGNMKQREEAYWIGFIFIIVNFLAVVVLHIYAVKKNLVSNGSPSKLCAKFIIIGVCLAFSAYLTMYQLAWSAVHLGQIPLTNEVRQLYPSLTTLPIMSYTFWPVSVVLLMFMVCSKNRGFMSIFLFLNYEAVAGSILYGIKLTRGICKGRITLYDPEVIFNFAMVILGLLNVVIYTSATLGMNSKEDSNKSTKSSNSTKIFGCKQDSIMNNYWQQFMERNKSDQSSNSSIITESSQIPYSSTHSCSPFPSEIPSISRATSTSRRVRRPLSYNGPGSFGRQNQLSVTRDSPRPFDGVDLQPLTNHHQRFGTVEKSDSDYYSRPSSMIL